jgi:hypothetical protein
MKKNGTHLDIHTKKLRKLSQTKCNKKYIIKIEFFSLVHESNIHVSLTHAHTHTNAVSCSGSRDRKIGKITSSRPAQAKLGRPYLKNKMK